MNLTARGKEDLTTMFNLGEGIYERAMEKGIEKGVEQEKRNSERKEREAALEMLKDGLSFEQISRYMKLSVEAVADIARENKLI
ncbi:transposase [Megasphaera hexanoica]|uniref:Transposase n=2 Tax=Megasphaera hexanoica TaxID=1675036 RepID=A0A848BNJ4_9FIRM|nr:transposase [Megasphaera hexanoica]